ncbi:MAG: thiosulfate oxidation carrier protein SoxY [Burkholderiales bacterium]|nr:thiosulfate oxidation carrier protein SoxY [Burkholderiales bacterium]
MDFGRRAFIRRASNTGVVALLVGNGFLKPGAARAALWNKPAFDATTLQEALGKIVDGPLAKSANVNIVAPEIAENGAVVPVGVVATQENIEAIAILCEKNPHPLAAIFEIPPGTLADVKTRVKMAESANIVVLVRASGTFHMAVKEIKITRGGCGG